MDRRARGRVFTATAVRHDIKSLQVGERGFRGCLKMFNGAISSKAVGLVVPRDETQLGLCIRIAADLGLTISCKAGGHGVAGRAVAGDVVVDFGSFRSLVRGDSLTVSVGSGVTWAELDVFSTSFGRVVPGGIVSSTGVVGLTLGGGIGWLLPLYGLSCDHLVSLTGVSADGRVVRLDDGVAPDLMKIARGYGHGLLAVTSLQFETRELPMRIDGGTVVFSIDDGVEVLSALSDASSDCPDEINYSPALLRRSGRPCLAVDGVSFGNERFADWICSQTAARPEAVSTGPLSYAALQRMLDNPARMGQRCSWRSWFGSQLNRKQIEVLAAGIIACPSPYSMILVERLAGAVNEPTHPSCFPLREASIDILILANWIEREHDDVNREWASNLKTVVASLSTSSLDTTYINYGDRSEHTLPQELEREVRDARAALDPRGIFSPSYR